MSYGNYIALRKFIKSGNVEGFKWYFNNLNIDKQYFVLRQQHKGSNNTVLHNACYSGNLEIVEFLVEDCGFSTDVRNMKNQSPLMVAIEGQQREIVEKLAEPESLQLCLSIVNILKCIEENNLDQLKMNWYTDCNVANFQSYEIHLMTIAAYKGNIDIFKFFMENGFSIDERNGQGMVPLLSACKHGHFELFKFLIENGCNMKVKNDHGDTPLMCACRGGNMDIVYYLLNENLSRLEDRNSIGKTPLMAAVPNVDIVKLLVNFGCDVNEADSLENTALIYATVDGNIETLEYLLSVGSDPSSRTKNWGMSPIHFACRHGFLDCVKLLTDAGSSLTHRSKNGNTPLMWAVLYGHLEVVKYLMSRGCKFTYDKNEEVALRIAKENGFFEVIEYINMQNN